jgi:signal transduction histidine kinase
MVRIQQAETALRHARDELELRVIERTTELSRANNALRSLSHRVVEVQEAERRAVARELHDEIGQLLTSLKLSLETSFQPVNDEQRAAVADALQQLNELMERVRQLSVSLRPQMLDDLGLLTALEWHFKRYAKQTGIRVQFRHTPVVARLPAPLETAAFRIVQEALTNVARHAAVKEATVRLWVNDTRLGLQVEDGGAGFDAAAALASHASSGLAGMRERAEMLGGEMTMESSPGLGTKLTVELPLPKAAGENGNVEL